MLNALLPDLPAGAGQRRRRGLESSDGGCYCGPSHLLGRADPGVEGMVPGRPTRLSAVARKTPLSRQCRCETESALAGLMYVAGVVETFVMLAEQIGAVVTAVRSADQGVDMVSGRNVVFEYDPRMMIELDHHNGTVDPVIERRIVINVAVPRKPCLAEVRTSLHDFHISVTPADPADVGG